jgi:hypothetical protein
LKRRELQSRHEQDWQWQFGDFEQLSLCSWSDQPIHLETVHFLELQNASVRFPPENPIDLQRFSPTDVKVQDVLQSANVLPGHALG